VRLAVLTGLYVGVVCSAQIGATKIVVLPWQGLEAPGGTYLIGLSLALVELAHLTAPSRREGWLNAEVMIGCGFAASAILAAWIAIVNAWEPAFPDQGFEVLADTWRIVLASLCAFIVSETVDNTLGAWMRGRFPDAVRVLGTNAVSIPLDSAIFLLAAFGSLTFFEGQVVAKAEATVLLGLPAVLLLRRFVRTPAPSMVPASG
jgi:queuosine precursor transporter